MNGEGSEGVIARENVARGKSDAPDTPKTLKESVGRDSKTSEKVDHTQKKPATIQDASIFLDRIRRQTASFDQLPKALALRIEDTVRAWNIAPNIDQSLAERIQSAASRIDSAQVKELFGDDDIDSLQTKLAIRKTPPLTYPLKEAYTSEDLEQRFSQGRELRQQLDGTIDISVYLSNSTLPMYTVENPEGRKQVLRIVSSKRPIEVIRQDLAATPDVIPTTTAYQFSDGSIGLLTDWVTGKHPETSEEKAACRPAVDELRVVPWEREHPNTPFDLNSTNLLINTEEGNQKAYYIDGDIPEIIAKYGLSTEVPGERVALLERGKEKI